MAGKASRENGKKGGRPKSSATIYAAKAREYIADRVIKDQKPIVDKAIEQAKQGDKSAREFLYNRAFGSPHQTVDHTSKGEKLPTPILNVSNNNGHE